MVSPSFDNSLTIISAGSSLLLRILSTTFASVSLPLARGTLSWRGSYITFRYKNSDRITDLDVLNAILELVPQLFDDFTTDIERCDHLPETGAC